MVIGLQRAAIGLLDSSANFDSEMATAMAGHLSAHHALLFTPNSGSLAGQNFLVVDLDGNAGYQTSADLVLHLTDTTGTLAVADVL